MNERRIRDSADDVFTTESYYQLTLGLVTVMFGDGALKSKCKKEFGFILIWTNSVGRIKRLT